MATPADSEGVSDDTPGRTVWAVGVGYALLLPVWPFASLGVLMMFDSPRAGGWLHGVLVYSTWLYGPLWLVALGMSIARSRRGDRRGAIRAWNRLCGIDIAVWWVAVVSITAYCGVGFAC